MTSSIPEYSQEVRNAAFELIRLWRMGWDDLGSIGYQSYAMAYRRFYDLTDAINHPGESLIALAHEILRD